MVYHKLAALASLCVSGFLVGYLFTLFQESRDVFWYAKIFALAGLEWMSCTLVYRLFLHPLAKYPGPLISAVTDWYTVYWISNGGRHLELHRRHQQYGKYVRFGPNRLSINSPEASRDLHHVKANTNKADAYGSFKTFFGAEMSLTTTDSKAHAFRRRVNVQAITPAIIPQFEELVNPHLDVFLDTVGKDAGFVTDGEKGWSSATEMSGAIAYCIADIMGSMTFGTTWDVQKEPQYRPFIKGLSQGVAGIHLVGHMQSLFMFDMHKILFKELITGVGQLMTMARSFALWRMDQTSMPHRDIYAHLLSATDPQTGNAFSRDELIAEAVLFIIGGTDGMITATLATLFYLLHNPRCLDRLTSEIRTAYPLPAGSKRSEVKCPIKFASKELREITYLPACIDEAMRITPPVPSILPRVVEAGGIIVDGEYFPEGVNLGIPHYSLHRNEEYYPQPHVYAPERWLPKTDGDSNKDKTPAAAVNDSGVSVGGGKDGSDGLPPAGIEAELLQAAAGQGPAFTPFGAGRGSCIGKYLAYQEMSIVIARLLWTFDVRILPGSTLGEGDGTSKQGRGCKDEYQLNDCFVSSQQGPEMQFRYRPEFVA